MQYIPRYLVNNRITIVANEAGFITEYRPVYQRHINIYRGIDNVLQFRLLNADQKPINIASYTPKFIAFDENDVMVVERDGSIQELSDSSATRGLFTVTINENDLLNLKDQFLKYSVYLENSDNENVLTYASSHLTNSGILNLTSDVFRGPIESKEVSFLAEVDSSWSTGGIDSQPGINGNEALHTTVFYTDSYTGNIEIQATLDNQLLSDEEQNTWTTINTVSFTGSESEPTAVNFNGVYNYIRFKTSTDPTSKISKILVRN